MYTGFIGTHVKFVHGSLGPASARSCPPSFPYRLLSLLPARQPVALQDFIYPVLIADRNLQAANDTLNALMELEDWLEDTPVPGACQPFVSRFVPSDRQSSTFLWSNFSGWQHFKGHSMPNLCDMAERHWSIWTGDHRTYLLAFTFNSCHRRARTPPLSST